MNLFDSNTQSANETSFVNLKLGTHIYRIGKPRLHTPQGKTDILVMADFYDSAGTRHTHTFAVGGQDMNQDRQRIGQGQLKAVTKAAGITVEPFGPEHLPLLDRKFVSITAKASKPGAQGEVYPPNIDRADPATGFETGAPAPVVHSADDALPGVTDTPPAESAPAATPAPAAGAAPRKSWKPLKVTKPAP